MAKIRMTNELRDILRTFAKKIVAPAEQWAAVTLCSEQFRDVVCARLEEVVVVDELLVLERFRALAPASSVRVYAGEKPYRGSLRDTIQWKDEGTPAKEGRVDLNFVVSELPVLGADGNRITRVPKSMLSNPKGYGREHCLVFYTLLGSELHTRAVALDAAEKAYGEERQRRLAVYDKLISAARNFEDLLEDWPEVRPTYLEVKRERASQLPATLSDTDRSILALDINERRVTIVGEAPAQTEA